MASIEHKSIEKVEVLIVEDSPTQAIQLQHLLEKHGCRVQAASNGLEALAHLQKHLPNIIISDIVMPEMDGFELCQKIKTDENYRDIPVILLTSLSQPQDIIKGLVNGANHFITKPYSEEFLAARINYIVVNEDIRKTAESKKGIEILFEGQKYIITSGRLQILELLLSTYEGAIQKTRELDSVNRELKITQEKLKVINKDLEKKVLERTERIAHLNRVTSAIRQINQLIVRERDSHRLVQSACESLIADRSYDITWLVLIDESGEKVKIAKASSDKKLLPVIERLEHDGLPHCMEQALAQPGVVVITDHQASCEECTLFNGHKQQRVMSVRLEHNGKIYGTMNASMSADFVPDEEENGLFQELSGDIAFALNRIELEKEHGAAIEAIKNLAKFPEENPHPVLRVSKKGILLFANRVRSSSDCLRLVMSSPYRLT